MTTPLPDARVRELIEAWGADAAAFPESERAAAQAALAQFPQRFAEDLAAARALDSALDDLSLHVPSRALEAALIAAAPRQRATRPSLLEVFTRPAAWLPAGALAALCMGFLGGAISAPAASAVPANEDFDGLVLGSLGADETLFSGDLSE